jgi:hypothetical protein
VIIPEYCCSCDWPFSDDPSCSCCGGHGHRPRVINLNRTREPHIYIGRGSDFGNPFYIGMDVDRAIALLENVGSPYTHKILFDGPLLRAKAIECHRCWVIAQPERIAYIRAQHRGADKVLGCYCKPRACHGDVHVEIAIWPLNWRDMLDELVRSHTDMLR